MKVIIEIPKDAYDYVMGSGYFPSNFNMISEIRNGTPIPDNATNGEVIKAMFPNIESRLDEKTGIMLVKWTDETTKTFKASWWNAPCQKGGK